MLSIISNLYVEKLTQSLFSSNQIKNLYNEYAINFSSTHIAYYQHESNEEYKDVGCKQYKELTGFKIYLAATSVTINEGDKEEITEIKRNTLYTNNFAANEINSKSRYKKKAFGNFYEPI